MGLSGEVMGLQLTYGMKNPRSSNHSLLNRCAFLCHPERSRGICSSADLSWKHGISSRHRIVISTGAYPDFLSRCAGQDRVCAFLLRKAHDVCQRHQHPQEIRGSAVERSLC
jgi:hypothetical protein